MKLRKHDAIIAAWAERASGPGWSNSPVWAVIRSALDGSHRVECIQPDEQTRDMAALYAVSEAAHRAMTAAVERAAETKETT